MKEVVRVFKEKEEKLLKEKDNIRKELLSQSLKEYLNKNGFDIKEIFIKTFKFTTNSAWNEIEDEGMTNEKIHIEGQIFDNSGRADFEINYKNYSNSYANGCQNSNNNLEIDSDDFAYENFLTENFDEIYELIENAYNLNVQ